MESVMGEASHHDRPVTLVHTCRCRVGLKKLLLFFYTFLRITAIVTSSNITCFGPALHIRLLSSFLELTFSYYARMTFRKLLLL